MSQSPRRSTGPHSTVFSALVASASTATESGGKKATKRAKRGRKKPALVMRRITRRQLVVKAKAEATKKGRPKLWVPALVTDEAALAYALRGPSVKCFGTHGRPVVQGERYTWMRI